MENQDKIYDSPKPTPDKATLMDRVFKHKLTSISGVVLIFAGLYLLNMDLDPTTKTTLGSALILAGIGGMGLKDPKK